MDDLIFKPVKQQAWYLQIKEKIASSKRPIDKMSIAEVFKMYENQTFFCDTCGKHLGKRDFSLEDHIIHLINPIILWSCDDCLIDDMKEGRIIGSTKEPDPKKWQIDNI